MKKTAALIFILACLAGCASSKAMKEQSEGIMPLITEEMTNTAGSFFLQMGDGVSGPNIIEGPNEIAGNDFDYAVDFIWRWNEKHGSLGSALLIVFTGWTEPELPRSPYTGTFVLLEKITDPAKKFDLGGDNFRYGTTGNTMFHIVKNKRGEQFIALRPTDDEFIYYHPKYPKPDAYKKRNEEVMNRAWIAVIGPEGSNWGVSIDPMGLDMTGTIKDNLRFFEISNNEMKILSDIRNIIFKEPGK